MHYYVVKGLPLKPRHTSKDMQGGDRLADGWTIREVARETGLSVHRIRQWERRYGLVRPRRLANGYRLYTAADVQRLAAVARAVDRGLQLREAIRRVTMSSSAPTPTGNDADSASLWAGVREAILREGARMNSSGVERILRRAAARGGICSLIDAVLRPVLVRVGELWRQGAWNEAQEQVTSEAVRRFCLGLLPYGTQTGDESAVLCAPVPGDRHDLPAIMTALGLEAQGWTTRLMGPSPAPGAIGAATQRLRPYGVVLVATTPRTLNPALVPFLEQELAVVSQAAGPATVLVGGASWPVDVEPPGVVRVADPGAVWAYFSEGPGLRPETP
jgi:DNA-binding transcriptional MerR regulator